MRALLQRVSQARVDIGGQTVARIDAGLLVLVGVERGDATADAHRMAARLLAYRVFADDDGRMNLSVMDTGGGVLLVPQFTLAADTRKGSRASFVSAAPPDVSAHLFKQLVAAVAARYTPVVQGRFGAPMQVALINDGPVTFSLTTRGR